MEIRNIAIIAHVDHGKTTLTDALLKQCGVVEEGVSMDSNQIEKERGITIYSKNTSLMYKGTKINIVDTPGHADFGGEVERVLRAIDTVLLIVDAQEGPMPQTRFVLRKSLELGLKPILVINKIDKPAANPQKAHDDVYILMMELGATDEQLDFTTVYAIGREGVAKRNLSDDSKDLNPLLDVILEKVPVSSTRVDGDFVAQVFNLGYDNFLGRLGITRVYEGSVKLTDTITVKSGDTSTKGKATKLFTFNGTERVEVEEVSAGDIVLVAGFPEISIGDTFVLNPETPAMKAISIDEPTISVRLLVNDSPLSGKDGKFVTTRQIKERLEKELQINVGLKVDFDGGDSYTVYGRGELHIAVLLENMRREGFEIQVSQPEAIIKEVDGVKVEPWEELVIDTPDEYSGTVIDKIGRRKGLMQSLNVDKGIARIVFEIPTRGLMGYRGQFVVDTKGQGILSSRFIAFKEFAGEIKKKETGAMISMENGKALAYALWNLQDRGTLYIGPQAEVYEGMVIGNTIKGEEMTVNPTKGKNQSNVRSSGNDEAIVLKPFVEVTIERGLELMSDDEYLEITPKIVRLRKQILNESLRNRAAKSKE